MKKKKQELGLSFSKGKRSLSNNEMRNVFGGKESKADKKLSAGSDEPFVTLN